MNDDESRTGGGEQQTHEKMQIQGDTDMPQDYYERREARRERLEARAEKARQEAQNLYANAHDMASIIPFGQPILVGHHSEKKDRKYRERIVNTFRKSFETSKKADYYAEKAEDVGNGGISSDAPDALELLEKKLAEREKAHAWMKEVNKAFKKGDAALLALGMTQAEIDQMRTAIPSYERQPYPYFSLANNNANIHRIKARIARLKAAANHVTTKTPFEGGTIVDNVEENRLQILFSEKPEAETRAKLKSHGFRWSPRAGAWQRMRSNSATYYAKMICGLTA